VEAEDPLGGDVLGGPYEPAGLRQLPLPLDLGDAEAGEDHAVVPAHHHVAGFHVTVQHTGFVLRGERPQHGEPDVGGLVRRDGPLFRDLAQRPAPQQLHDDPRPAVLADHVVDGDHRRMIDTDGRPGLALHVQIGGPTVRRGEVLGPARLLDGHVPVHHLVMGPPHRTHAAGAQPLQQPVTAAH